MLPRTLTLALLLVLAGATARAEPPSTPHDICPLLAGQPVPEGITVLDQDGAPVDLSQTLRERPTLLIFYRGGW